MRRAKVRLLPTWHVYVDDVQIGPGEVAEVAEEHAEQFVERGVAVLVEEPQAKRRT